jgi:hypothetical protein
MLSQRSFRFPKGFNQASQSVLWFPASNLGHQLVDMLNF